MSWYRYDDEGNLILTLHIQTGAKNTEAANAARLLLIFFVRKNSNTVLHMFITTNAVCKA